MANRTGMAHSCPMKITEDVCEYAAEHGSAEKELKVYKDAKHEIYNDLVREQAYEDLRAFLNDVVKKGE
jgi:alpha-beta hydrolase superfamily lysophospholipase